MPLKALIFDVDGTLAETEELHRQAFNETFWAHSVADLWPDAKNGWKWDQLTYRRLLATTGGKERIAAYLRDDLGIDPAPWTDQIAAIHRTKTERYVALIAGGALRLRPGISELIDEGLRAGLKLAIATTTSRPNVDELLRFCFGPLGGTLFSSIHAGEDVVRKKPAPDVYILSLDRLGVPASECIAFEDSRNGLIAAHAAGLRCIISPSMYTAGDDLSGADLTVNEFSEVKLERLITAAST